MSQHDMQQIINTANTLFKNLVQASEEHDEFDMDLTVKHLGVSVSLVVGQIAAYQQEQNNVKITDTCCEILNSITHNLAIITKHYNQPAESKDKNCRNLH